MKRKDAALGNQLPVKMRELFDQPDILVVMPSATGSASISIISRSMRRDARI